MTPTTPADLLLQAAERTSRGDAARFTGWPGAPFIVDTKSGPDGNALYRLADPKCKTWNKVGDMKLVPWPEAGS